MATLRAFEDVTEKEYNAGVDPWKRPAIFQNDDPLVVPEVGWKIPVPYRMEKDIAVVTVKELRLSWNVTFLRKILGKLKLPYGNKVKEVIDLLVEVERKE